MIWHISNRCDSLARQIADRHYSRQTVGAANFVQPGRCFVLHCDKAYWVTAWPFAEYVMHRWAGAWMCAAFRNEGAGLSSDLIRQAVAATRWRWPVIPALGMITFVDEDKVRKKRDPGRCFIRAGFRFVGKSEGGLLAFQLLPSDMPLPEQPIGTSFYMFGEEY